MHWVGRSSCPMPTIMRQGGSTTSLAADARPGRASCSWRRRSCSPALAEAFAAKHGYALTTPLAALMACSVVRSELGDEVRAALGLKSLPPHLLLSPEEGVEEADAEAADAEADEAEEPAAEEPEPEPEPAEAVPSPPRSRRCSRTCSRGRARADAGRGLVVDASEPRGRRAVVAGGSPRRASPGCRTAPWRSWRRPMRRSKPRYGRWTRSASGASRRRRR